MGNCAYRRWAARVLGWLALLLLAGCVSLPPPSEPPSEVPAPVEPAEPVAAAPPSLPPPRAAPVPPTRAEIVVVLDTSAPTHAAVAQRIVAELPPRLYRVTELASTDTEGLARLRERNVTIVAVGAQAVRTARAVLPGKPLVFCQVLSPAEALGTDGPVWGVQSLPPLSLQLKSWQAVDPSLRTIALIVSESGAPLAAEARRAASERGADLVVTTSSSDRETLYLFRRLATDVDGLWLLPDNNALSPQVLRELLEYASARGIGVLTFNEALLRRGALLSATAVPDDVAQTVHRILGLVVAGKTAGLAPMTPLSAAELTINQSVAANLGLLPVAEPRWVAREPD